MPRSPRWCTADAGLFTFEVPGGTGEVWMLTRDGAWTRIGDHVVGIPMTDIAGHHAFWTERDRGFRVVAYSTADEQVVNMLPIPDLRFVHAVDDDQAFVGEGEDWWLWTAGGGTRDTPVLVRDFRAGTGDVVLRIGPSYRGVGLVRDGDGTVCAGTARWTAAFSTPMARPWCCSTATARCSTCGPFRSCTRSH